MDVTEIKRVLIVGAGTMGHSIAQIYAQAGYNVDLVDLNNDILNRAISLIKSNLNILVEFNKVDRKDIPIIINRINLNTDIISAAKNADFVTEVVSEVPEVKRNVFLQLDKYCSEDVVLASNTSTLDIFRIVKNIQNIKNVITHHYYAPAHIIPLVEIAPGRRTSKEIVEFSMELMRKIGKKPLLMKKFAPLYIVNKIQNAITGAMYELITRGLATPEQIDLAIKNSLGIKLPVVGQIQSQDFMGLDLINDILKARGIDVNFINKKINKGHLGVKSGIGFYDYGGRSEQEILRKRDILCLQMLEHLKKINAFKPI